MLCLELSPVVSCLYYRTISAAPRAQKTRQNYFLKNNLENTDQFMTDYKTSTKGNNIIKSFETVHDGDLSIIGLQPKMCPAGYWTSGYGSLVLDNLCKPINGIENKDKAYRFNKIHTVEDAEKQLQIDLVKRENKINRLGLNIDQNQFDALVSFVYNLGFGNFSESTLLKLIQNNPKDFMIAYELPKWRRAGGKILPGLVRRRRAEASLYFTGEFN